MKLYLLLVLILSTTNYASKANELNDQVNQGIEDNITSTIRANDEVSDQALLAYIKRMFKYMPGEWHKLENQNPAERKNILQNFRNYHSHVGLSISETVKLLDESPAFEEMMAQIWAEDTLGVEYAESVLLNLTRAQYQDIMDAAKALTKNNPLNELTILTDNYPEKLNFLEIKKIRVSNGYCEIYLYKGIGSMKSIGFSVKKQQDGSWDFSQFNYLKSYEHVPINLGEIEGN